MFELPCLKEMGLVPVIFLPFLELDICIHTEWKPPPKGNIIKIIKHLQYLQILDEHEGAEAQHVPTNARNATATSTTSWQMAEVIHPQPEIWVPAFSWCGSHLKSFRSVVDTCDFRYGSKPSEIETRNFWIPNSTRYPNRWTFGWWKQFWLPSLT